MLPSLGKTCRAYLDSLVPGLLATTITATALAAVTLASLAATPAAAAAQRVTQPRPAHFLTYSSALPRLAATQPHPRPRLAAPAAPTYQVAAGDTLSGITQAHLTGGLTWRDLWHANAAQVRDPNLIYPGQALTLPTGHVAGPSAPAAARRVPAAASRAATGGYRRSATRVHGPAAAHVDPNGYGGFQACVIRRESGGSSQVMNGTGHYGLYQFSYPTWVRYGGSPGSFGHASVAEQNQVFANAMATPGGAGNWAPYDGC